MGTPEFAIPVLDELYKHHAKTLIGIFTRPDAPKGRGQKMALSPVKNWAQTHKIPVYTPSTKTEAAEQIQALEPDLIIVVAYGMILPPAIVQKYPCINIHASLLPKYRGASPIQSAILNQDTHTGITLMKISEKMDAGDILFQEKIPILAHDDFSALHEKLSQFGAVCLTQFLQTAKHPLTGIPQTESQATYCQKLTYQDRVLDPAMPPAQFLAKVRAFSPAPGALLLHNGKSYKILDAELENGKIAIRIIQPPGKIPMTYEEFQRGYKLDLLP